MAYGPVPGNNLSYRGWEVDTMPIGKSRMTGSADFDEAPARNEGKEGA
jgi:hypothetical protein